MIRTETFADGAGLRVILDAPPGNVIGHVAIEAMSRMVDAHAADPEIKVICFEGTGAHFSFGASVGEHRRGEVESFLPAFHHLFRRLLSVAIPTVAIVRGQCLGGGLELAAWCTWIFASPEARLGQPEVKLGVFPPVASLILPWKIGGARALDLCVSGRSLSAKDAYEFGLVTRIAEDPRAAAGEFIAEHVLPRSATGLRFAERAARHSLATTLSGLEGLEALYLNELMATPDAEEGIQAFLERRPPRFGGAA